MNKMGVFGDNTSEDNYRNLVKLSELGPDHIDYDEELRKLRNSRRIKGTAMLSYRSLLERVKGSEKESSVRFLVQELKKEIESVDGVIHELVTRRRQQAHMEVPKSTVFTDHLKSLLERFQIEPHHIGGLHLNYNVGQQVYTKYVDIVQHCVQEQLIQTLEDAVIIRQIGEYILNGYPQDHFTE